MRAIALLLLFVGLANAETYHLWYGAPVIVNGRQRGHHTPHRGKLDAFVSSLKAAGHEVVRHNVTTEGHPGVPTLPAVTVLYEGRHVVVTGVWEPRDLSVAKVDAERVAEAKKRFHESVASHVAAEASALRIEAAEKAVLADKLRERGAVAEADAIEAEAASKDAEAAAKDQAAVEEAKKVESVKAEGEPAVPVGP